MIWRFSFDVLKRSNNRSQWPSYGTQHCLMS